MAVWACFANIHYQWTTQSTERLHMIRFLNIFQFSIFFLPLLTDNWIYFHSAVGWGALLQINKPVSWSGAVEQFLILYIRYSPHLFMLPPYADYEPSPRTALRHPTGQQPTLSIVDWLLSFPSPYLWLAVEHVLVWVAPDAACSSCLLRW
jgi:hypothetical protein